MFDRARCVVAPTAERAPGADDALEFVRAGRVRIQEALRELAPDHLDEGRLILRLDTFGDDIKAEVRGHRDDRLGHDHRAIAVRHVDDEAAVDLDAVNRQSPQAAERGVAGAEIVDRDLHANGVQPPQHVGAVAHVPHDPGLGDLQLETARRQPALP